MNRVLAVGYVVLTCGASVLFAAGADRTWHSENGFKWAELEVPGNGKTGFILLTPKQTGIEFTNVLFEFSSATNRVLENGAGVALGDYDNDGLVDIFVCGLDSPSALFRNLGDWRFTNVTTVAGLEFRDRYQRGGVFADINGDGSLDLLVSTLNRGVLCFLNDGHGRFKDVTAAAGTATSFGSVTMALADIDGNGTLDLYVANYRADDIRNRGSVRVYQRNGQYVIPPEFKDRLVVLNGVVREFGEPDILYLNDGQGHFTPLSWTDGRFLNENGEKLKRPPLDWGQTVTFRDLNGDGSPDIYVCNDFWTVDRIWMNDGQGNFRAIDRSAIRHVCFSSMGVDFADINRDGNLDFLVTDMQSRDPRLRKRQVFAFAPRGIPFDPLSPPMDIVADRPQIMRNTLFLNRGDGTYTDIADYAGVASADWAWQQIFLDVDLDGYEDLLISAGFFRDVQDRDAIAATASRRPILREITDPVAAQLAFSMEKMTNSRLFPPYECPIIAFRNQGNLQFEETTRLWGTDQQAIHHGLAIGDLDNDGGMDLVVNNFNSALGIYRNTSNAPRVAVRLKGRTPNTQGIGAKIKLLNGAVPMQSQEIICGGRYLSGSEPVIGFAAGQAKGGMTIEVTWRNGKVSLINGVMPNRLYEIDETAAIPAAPKQPKAEPSTPLFQDMSEVLAHTHHEEPYDDFVRQPLLPFKRSQLGPGVAWFDLDGDGWDDLIIGSGKGGALSIFHNDRQGGFERKAEAVVARDQTGLLCWRSADNAKPIILAGSANYEDALALGASVRQYDLTKGALDDSLPAQACSIGPLAMADMDGDGNLELFVGGRVIPGRYPEAASSSIYRFERGQWQVDIDNSQLLEKVGLVSGAVWSDLDGDGLPDLILACEWGPIRVFQNQKGKLQEATSDLGLAKYTGWWNGVTTGDIDGDGRLDIIASNWGLNSPYHATAGQPIRFYYGEFSGRKAIDVIETEYDPVRKVTVPRRTLDVLANALSSLRERFPTHKAFSEATIAEVLGSQKVHEVAANTLASMVFFNRGSRFEGVELSRGPTRARFCSQRGGF